MQSNTASPFAPLKAQHETLICVPENSLTHPVKIATIMSMIILNTIAKACVHIQIVFIINILAFV